MPHPRPTPTPTPVTSRTSRAPAPPEPCRGRHRVPTTFPTAGATATREVTRRSSGKQRATTATRAAPPIIPTIPSFPRTFPAASPLTTSRGWATTAPEARTTRPPAAGAGPTSTTPPACPAWIPTGIPWTATPPAWDPPREGTPWDRCRPRGTPPCRWETGWTTSRSSRTKNRWRPTARRRTRREPGTECRAVPRRVLHATPQSPGTGHCVFGKDSRRFGPLAPATNEAICAFWLSRGVLFCCIAFRCEAVHHTRIIYS
mmetsp:Transcript_4413/g.9575  ORF Transcript_4413/g.9575 Transcript_4413/m.9575 type:complete len:259 (+) Transcript_4413:1398-2174(+)